MKLISTKQWMIAGAIALCMTSCDEPDTPYPYNEIQVNEDRNIEKTVELMAIANSAQVEKAYTAILKKAGLTDPELVEFNISFHVIRGIHGYKGSLSVQMVSPKNKNNILNYSYNFETSKVAEPVDVKLSSGIGTNERSLDTYGDFKTRLFKKGDMVSFDKLDGIYAEAMKASGYDPEECYVDVVSIKKSHNHIESYLKVQSTKSVTAYKNIYFDLQGKLNL